MVVQLSGGAQTPLGAWHLSGGIKLAGILFKWVRNGTWMVYDGVRRSKYPMETGHEWGSSA